MTAQNNPKENFQIKGDWNAQSKQLQEKYTQLTDSDLAYLPGEEEDLLKRVQTRLGKKREDVISIIADSQPQQN